MAETVQRKCAPCNLSVLISVPLSRLWHLLKTQTPGIQSIFVLSYLKQLMTLTVVIKVFLQLEFISI